MKDPENVKLNDLRDLRTIEDVLRYANTNYPGWIAGFADRYSDDYPHLTCTWVEMSKMLKTAAAQIILVSYVPLLKEGGGSDIPVLAGLCDIFSRSGFMMRRNEEFLTCPVCDALIPTQKAYTKLTVKPPFPWKNRCRLCSEEEETRPLIIEELD
jgi:hypothetical protein